MVIFIGFTEDLFAFEMHWKSEQKLDCCNVDENENGSILMSNDGVSALIDSVCNPKQTF